jgi:16S rRNA (adenine1518-N6/adenine1519-N6)-dimethyltransferase
MVAENLKLKQQARDFSAKKRLGQHFLTNAEALTRIAEQANISKGDHLLEIGPGLGFLTKILVDFGATVTAVELDIDCVEYLRSLNLPGLEVIHQDFLQCDLAQILKSKTKVIGNIPYQITTPIIARLLGEIGEPSPWLSSIESIIFTMQREVAYRLVANQGEEDYSQISLLAKYFSERELLFIIAAEDFFPIPEVTSAVVKLTPHAQPKVSCLNHRLLRQIIQSGFRQRRKMLKNNLSFLHIEPSAIDSVFAELRFDPQVRAERLGLEQFALLTDKIETIREKTSQSK